MTDTARPWDLRGPFSAFFNYRSLTLELAKREVAGRYRGASFGLLWSVISPFLMLCVYTFAFGYIMKGRWPQQVGDSHAGFALILFIGLIVHGFFAECLTRSATLIVGNANFVKRVIFPLEILPWPMIISALFHAFMNVLVFVALTLLVGNAIPITIFILPLVFIPFVIMSVAVSWVFAALGVYFRDLSQVTGVLATAMLFTSSAMIPVASLPLEFRRLFALNPLTFIIDQAREVALWGHMPDWRGLAIYSVLALAAAYLGYFWFVATKKGFADVL